MCLSIYTFFDLSVWYNAINLRLFANYIRSHILLNKSFKQDQRQFAIQMIRDEVEYSYEKVQNIPPNDRTDGLPLCACSTISPALFRRTWKMNSFLRLSDGSDGNLDTLAILHSKTHILDYFLPTHSHKF